ncbi:hypothetical protein D3C72_1664150 [compost metagenome]
MLLSKLKVPYCPARLSGGTAAKCASPVSTSVTVSLPLADASPVSALPAPPASVTALSSLAEDVMVAWSLAPVMSTLMVCCAVWSAEATVSESLTCWPAISASALVLSSV